MYHCWHKVSNNMLIMWLYGNYGVVLLTEPIMRNLIKIVIPKVKASWQNLAYSMRYRIDEVRAFKMESSDRNEQCENLFADWLSTNHGPNPKTYQTLLKCIKDVDELTAASEEIEGELIKGKD